MGLVRVLETQMVEVREGLLVDQCQYILDTLM